MVPACLRGLANGRGGVRYRLERGFPRRGCKGQRGARTHLVCFSFRAFRFATRCLGSRRGLVVEDDFAALGAAGGGDIRRRNKRAVLPAQMLCISGQVRRPGFPGLRQPIDPIVALQSAALHFRAAERTIQTNLLLFRYPQERDLGKPSVFPVLSPAAKEKFPIIFGGACTCRKFFDPAAGGGAPSDRHHWGGGI